MKIRPVLRRDSRICRVCGKEFFVTSEWRFRKKREKDGYICSWSCFQKEREGTENAGHGSAEIHQHGTGHGAGDPGRHQ